jgi:hypothetical protein
VDHILTAEGRQVLDAADKAVNTRLCELAGHLGSEEETDLAFEGLLAWRRALGAYRRARGNAR